MHCLHRIKILLPALAASITLTAQATGIYRDGLNAESSGQAGIHAVGVQTPLAIMTGNPAGLAKFEESVSELNLTLADFDARYSNSLNSDSASAIDRGLIPAVAWIKPAHNENLVWGFAATADVALQTDFTLIDPPGGLAGVSYGRQQHASKFIVLELSGGLGWQLSDRLDVGASLGLVFNQNELTAPYIFQAQAPSILPGFKTLLDLQVDGWGIATRFGANYRLTDSIELGLSYRPESRIDSDGRVTGDATAQLAQLGISGFQPDFAYDVSIKTRVPAVTSLALDMQLGQGWNLLGQVDWIRSSSYDNLRLHLDQGNNADLNNLLGDDGFTEVAPLDWDDQLVWRVGAKRVLNSHWTLRGGLAITRNPIPSATLTPLTGATWERVIGLGLTRSLPNSRVDLGYQYLGGGDARVGTSALLAGEYSNSRFQVSGHWINISWQF